MYIYRGRGSPSKSFYVQVSLYSLMLSEWVGQVPAGLLFYAKTGHVTGVAGSLAEQRGTPFFFEIGEAFIFIFLSSRYETKRVSSSSERFRNAGSN